MCKYKLSFKNPSTRLALMVLPSLFSASAWAGTITTATNSSTINSASIQKSISKFNSCSDYDKMITKGSESPIITTCDTIDPKQLGLRSWLGDRGFLFEGYYTASEIYDVLGHEQRPQIYNGQRPNYSGSLWLDMTYDLERIGFNKGDQVTLSMNSWQNAYTGAGIRSTALSQASVFQNFWNGRVTVQYGYYGLIGQFYGMFLGSSTASSALGPQSIIPNEVGMSMYTPTPGIDIRMYSKDRRFYNHFGFARSQSPEGYLADSQANPSGVNFRVNGTRPIYVDEVGYRVRANPSTHMTWFRAGGIYNSTAYFDYNSGKYKNSNSAFYVVFDRQVTMPDPTMPSRGWYFEVKTDQADRAKNVFAADYAATIYSLGPTRSRSQDMISIGFTYNKIGAAAVNYLQRGSSRQFNHSTTTSISYAYHLLRGVYFLPTFSYTTKPVTSIDRPDAFTMQGSLTVSF